MVGGIEAESSDVSEGADELAVVAGAEGIAAILDQPEIVLLGDAHDLGEIEGIAEGVRNHDGARLGSDGGFDLVGLNVVGGNIDIDEDGNESVLHRRIDGGRKTGGDGNDLIAGAQRLLLKLGRGECGNGEQVGRRAGVGGHGPADIEKFGEFALEIGIEASGGQPEIERGIDRVADFLGAENLARGRNHAFARNERRAARDAAWCTR